MPKCYVIAGGMFGDEGKGRVAQYFTKRCIDDYGGAICIRSVGGANAGHTVFTGDKKHKVHLLPVGALYHDTSCIIGNGVYIDVELLLQEMKLSRCRGIYISPAAHVVFPLHKAMDAAKEEKSKLGTTKRGISLAAASKFSYGGIRIGDVTSNNGQKIVTDFVNSMKTSLPDGMVDVDANINVWKLARELRDIIVNPWEILDNEEDSPENGIVVEGAQGAMLDVNHGYMYPFVSAGSFTFNGLMDGVGYHLDPTDKILVLKSYNSLMSPAPIEGEIKCNERFIKAAGEFGTTTGRPRRVGWLDTNLLKHSIRINRPTAIFLNRLDTLNWFINNDMQYSLQSGSYTHASYDRMAVDLYNKTITRSGEHFILEIEKITGVKVKYVGIGPKETDVIVR
jgi:adenylosuccinate synthase